MPIANTGNTIANSIQYARHEVYPIGALWWRRDSSK
jgi:hypothetical protein